MDNENAQRKSAKNFTAKVLLFASLRDAAGERIEIEIPRGATVQTLLDLSAKQLPSIAAWLPHVRVAVNCEYADNTRVLSPDDEIAFLPPVSGGAQSGEEKGSTVEFERTPFFIYIVDERIDVEKLVAWTQNSSQGSAGAILPFIGVVRNNAAGRDVSYLDYQVYPAMAKGEMAKVASEVVARWDACCALVHRVGKLEIGEASIAIVVATPHRAEAFEACRFAIDRVKETVPIWKKEVAPDGSWWVEDPLAKELA